MFAIILGSFGRVFKAFHRNDFIATTPSKVKLVVTNKYMIFVRGEGGAPY